MSESQFETLFSYLAFLTVLVFMGFMRWIDMRESDKEQDDDGSTT